MVRSFGPIRRLQGLLIAGVLVVMGAGATGVLAQSQAPPAKPQDKSQDKTQDNPFPGDAPQAPAAQKPAPSQPAPGSSANPNAKPDPSSGKPKSDNPFPGEDPDAPIIPVDPVGPGDAAGARPGGAGTPSTDSAGSARRSADPDGDPVRSPDPAGNYRNDDGFSSSRSGLNTAPAGDDSDEVASKAARGKSSKQLIKEDLDVGGFYLDKKNWKAAQARFSSAFALDAENPDTVWGLAESERHLQLYKEAAEHYKLFLNYEPDGRRGREARKALDEVEAAKVTAPAGAQPR